MPQKVEKYSHIKLVWLSHILSSSTPLYGGSKDLSVNSMRSINRGDSSNSSMLNMPSHAGTHIDAPYHFLQEGKKIEAFAPDYWIFKSPVFITLSVYPGMLIGPDDIAEAMPFHVSPDLLLLKTGFEINRHSDLYWREGPGLSASLATYLKDLYPGLRAVGVDFISISGWNNREEGRKAHRAFLERDIILIEDMHLLNISDSGRLIKVIALPLRFEGADGAPCSILAWIDEGG